MRFILLLFVSLMVCIAYLTQLNPDAVNFFYSDTKFINISVISLSLVAMSIGGFIVLMVGGVGEFKNMISNWRNTREEKKKDKINSLYVNAVNCLTAGRNKDAIIFFKKILSIKPGHINSLVRLGNIFKMEGDLNEALRLHRRARTISEENLEIFFAIIDDLEASLRYEEAIVALNDLLKENESNITALRKLRDLYVKKEKWASAYDVQKRLVKMDLTDEELELECKRHLELMFEVGTSYLNEGNCQEARGYYADAIKLDKYFLLAYMGIAESDICDGKRRNAAEFLEKAYRETGMLEILLKLEDIYIDLGEPDKVIAIYHETVDDGPESSLKRFLSGKLYFRLEMLDDALDTLYPLASEDHPSISIILGSIYARKGDINLAADEFKNLLAVKEEHLYICKACKKNSSKWTAKCDHCSSWNSIFLTPIIHTAIQPAVHVPIHR